MTARLLLLAAVAALLTAGCSESSAPPVPAAQPTAPAATATAEPQLPSASPTPSPSAAPFAAEYTQICAHLPVGALSAGQEAAVVAAALERIPAGLPSRSVAREECPDGTPEPGAVPLRVVFAGAVDEADLVAASQAVTGGTPGATAVSGPGEGTGVSVAVPWVGPDVPPLSPEQADAISGPLRAFSLQPGPAGTAVLRYIGPPVTDGDLQRIADVLEQAAGAPAGSAELRPWDGAAG